MKKAIIKVLEQYKKHISPFFIKSCRFYPSCSEYSAEAIKEHGVIKGTFFSLWRIARCNPFSRGGHDPVRKTRKEK
ncbi:MAG: membrane protein insertion efficiency factor YidD [Candidatus Aadella gelida]|nr:membrane protein insertion efficiency factor YidD [Candidatus Aadella gelida]